MEGFEPLIQGCLKNDRKSQERLYKQLYVPLFCLCRRFFANDHEAIESVNDGMLRVFENISAYRPEKGKFFNWVYTIVRNTAIDKFKNRVASYGQSDPMIGLEDTEADVSYHPLSSLDGKDLYLLLDRLPPATRVICNLFYLEGYSIKEIASQLSISDGTVKWHLSESRQRLKSIVKRHFNE
ncbi:MAG TPA: sigma-70 family RNA polymerase sigma factor [Puia sp.]|nr:sigma-70 family RNA polymerase sigma factor [Puia sp.]